MEASKQIVLGTIRVKINNLKSYQKTSEGWQLIKTEFPELLQVVKLFKASKRLKYLVDIKNPEFFKGQLSPEGRELGARINILPTGEKLEKAFSLFSPHLKIHDQDSHDHWDVMYQNKGGTWSYVYTSEKIKAHKNKKYHKVDEFEKCHFKLKRNVSKSLLDNTDFMALPLFTLLQTYMRVGNEIYFKVNGHKGLTTLTKKDISVKGSLVNFHYFGKDGVPINISQNFSLVYVKRLKELLKNKKEEEFVFSKNSLPLHEQDFKQAFLKYCGHEFYPHIVRSHYATMQVKKFLTKKKKCTKEEVDKLFLSIAHNLGHKKFNKEKQGWQEHYTVTVNSYISPVLVEKVKGRIIQN